MGKTSQKVTCRNSKDHRDGKPLTFVVYLQPGDRQARSAPRCPQCGQAV